jgi:ClpP class serine protease
MIDSDYAANFLPLISAYIKGETIPENISGKEHKPFISVATMQARKYTVSQWDDERPEDAPENSVAILNIQGAITKHNQFCGPVGMVAQANLLDRCYANDNIKGIVINMESGGGEAYAMRIFNEAIARKNKPVVGFVNDFACSAAFGNISGCDRIVANSELARVGSLGTYQTIADHSEYFKNQGINLIEIYATESKDKNRDFHEALKGNLEPLRKSVDVFNNVFLEQIEANRAGKLTADRKEWGTGKVYFAKDAIKLGLIDDIDTFENVLNYF